MDGNTRIGMSHVSVKAYCTRCECPFGYSYNGCKPMSRSGQCPICGKVDCVETDDFIDSHIMMMQSIRGMQKDPEKVKQINEEIYKLMRIKGELNERNH
jgi:hypothetical protein